MWRYLVGGLAALLLSGAGWLIFLNDKSGDATARAATILPAMTQASAPQADDVPADLPAAPERTREQKRFDRYDKDRNAKITREEYLLSRRKAFAKLDLNRDGQLSFDEWSAKTAKRFADADADRSGALNATEFATTKPKRKSKRPVCACPAASPRDDD
ncbi:EF-hand domain-containing protein [Sphingomonas sp. Mn802worker]|uniref:EF-hand domain-containing protein n=1 Tax=Sphingomonas sp. Mn802worker TaxID=629773 RepID=UPI0003626BC4|nr:EF-hand domain-containing protein [Sphingomonas sp. Mn802worker]